MSLLAFVLPLLAQTVTADYTANAEAGFHGLQGWYNTTSGLWDTCSWWNGANCKTAIGDLAVVDSSIVSEVTKVFANTYSVAPAYNPQPLKTGDVNSADPIAWCDHCYDDNGWWALAWVQAYDVTKNRDYLDLAKANFDQNMVNAGPTDYSDGGVVCSSHNRLDPSDKAHCTTIAQDQWTWFQSSGLINDDNLINDGLEYNCTNTGLRTVWSYNEGVILGGLVELNRASPDQSIIDSANVLAKAAIANLTDSNHIVHDVCEPNCFPDQTQFKGIFIRNLVLLQQEPPCDLYKTVITANAESIWSHDRVTKNNTFSVDWSGPVVGKVNAIISSSALDGLIGAISVTQQ